MGERCPHLLARHHPLVAVADGAGLQRRKVRARVGLREPLAPDLVGGQDRRQVAVLLLLGPVRDHHRAAHCQPEDVGHLGSLGADDLLVEDRLLDERRAASAVLLGPGEPRPPGLEQLPLPLAAEGEGGLVAIGLAAGMVLGEPGAQLVAEGLLLGGKTEIHLMVGRIAPGARFRAGHRSTLAAPCGSGCSSPTGRGSPSRSRSSWRSSGTSSDSTASGSPRPGARMQSRSLGT
jgi:hypothetical protein